MDGRRVPDIQKKPPLKRRGGHCHGRMEGWEVGHQIYQKTHPSKGRVGGVVIEWMDGRWEEGCQIYIYKNHPSKGGVGSVIIGLIGWVVVGTEMPEKKKTP